MSLEAAKESFDESIHIETIAISWTGIILTTVLALLSVTSSAVVIHLIFRSEKKLVHSVYHRILFGMSVADVFHYFAMALTTLPLPTDMIYTGYKGVIVGNNITCQIQASFISGGAMVAFFYNVMLSVYYLCSLYYEVVDATFRRFIEPLLHFLCIVLTTVSVVIGNINDSFHPDPIYASYCVWTVYPYWCSIHDCVEIGVESSASGAEKVISRLAFFPVAFMVLSFVIIAISMLMIVIKIYRQSRQAPRSHSEDPVTIDPRFASSKKIILKQALAYFFVNLIAFLVVFLSSWIRKWGVFLPTKWWQVVLLVMRPSQGIFNSCIFIYHKAFSLQRQDRLLGFCEAFILALKGKEGEERVISHLELVKRNQALDRIPMARNASFVSNVGPNDATSNKQGQQNQDIFAEMDQVQFGTSIELSQNDISGLSGSDDIGIDRIRTRGSSVVSFVTPDRLIGATPDPSFASSKQQDLSGFSMSDANDIACIESKGGGSEELEELSFEDDTRG